MLSSEPTSSGPAISRTSSHGADPSWLLTGNGISPMLVGDWLVGYAGIQERRAGIWASGPGHNKLAKD